jgi:hypothetical protein
MATITLLRLGHADFVRDRTDKAGELAGDRRGDGRDGFARPAELAILKAEGLYICKRNERSEIL